MDLDLPIRFEYARPTQAFLDSLQAGDSCVEVREEPGLILAGTYFRQGVRGALEKTYLRARVLECLLDALKRLPFGFGFVIFDAYRSQAAQAGLFDAYSRLIARRYPDWSAEALHAETRKFVAHPDEPNRIGVPPHNSGGAIDLGLTYQGRPADMGTPFDDLTAQSAMDFFENAYDSKLGMSESQWAEARTRRRLLFHSMRGAGFTNWKHEWWHFDMGDRGWSKEFGIEWSYGSMPVSSSECKPEADK